MRSKAQSTRYAGRPVCGVPNNGVPRNIRRERARDQRIDELVGETSRAIDGTGEIDIVFYRQLQSDLEFTHCRVEPWLIWTGSEPLALSRPPEPY
jgi:hypothetical protein